MKLLTIIQREFLSRVRTKGFLVFTFLVPALAAGFLLLESKILQASQNVTSNVAVVDMSHQLYPALAQAIEASHAERAARLARPGGSAFQGDPVFNLRLVEATPETLVAVEAQLRQQVMSRAEDGYLVIPADVLSSRAAEYHLRNAAAIGVSSSLEDRLGDAVNRARMEADGVPASQLATLDAGFDLHSLQLAQRGGERADSGQAAGLAIGLALVLYMFLVLYGVVVMKSVTEEKTTRISEILLSAVDPFSLMLGKILGVVSAALTQLLVWGLCLALAGAYGIGLAAAAGSNVMQYLPHIRPGLFAAFILFFLLGFLVYASVYAAIGAMVSSDQEAQQTQMPLTMLLMLSLYLAFLVMATPNSPLSVALSLIPFSAPVLMVMRIAVSSPPQWQVALAAVLCLGTFLALTKVTAKIYQVGILMTGKRPNLPELVRWLKYA